MNNEPFDTLYPPPVFTFRLFRLGDNYSDTGGGECGQPYEDVAGFCRSVTLAEIAEHGHVLTPGRYVGAEEVEEDDEAFADKMARLTKQLGGQMSKGAELDQLIKQKLGGLGYVF